MAEGEQLIKHESYSLQSSDLIDIYPPKTKWELVNEDQVPPYLRTPHIISGYRVHFSFKLCVQSLFRTHNELTNIYSHGLGSLGFIAFYIWLYVTFLSHMKTWLHFALITAYTAAVAWLLMCSATFHCFNCISPAAFSCVARLDYSGIGVVILTSQWVAMFYSFVCWDEPFWVFTGLLCFFTVVVVVGPMFKFFHHRRMRVVRALIYVCMSVVFPVTWLIMVGVRYGFYSVAIVTLFYKGMGYSLLGYGCGIFFYLSRIPERFWPGKFDYFLQSHMNWHLCVVAGAALLLYSYINIATIISDNSCVALEKVWFGPY